jgi:MFS family permease
MMSQIFKTRDFATNKAKYMEFTPEQLESLMIMRTFMYGFYILLGIIVAIIFSPFVADYYWRVEVPISGVLSIVNLIAIPLSGIIGALLARWKSMDRVVKKEDE